MTETNLSPPKKTFIFDTCFSKFFNYLVTCNYFYRGQVPQTGDRGRGKTIIITPTMAKPIDWISKNTFNKICGSSTIS